VEVLKPLKILDVGAEPKLKDDVRVVVVGVNANVVTGVDGTTD